MSDMELFLNRFELYDLILHDILRLSSKFVKQGKFRLIMNSLTYSLWIYSYIQGFPKILNTIHIDHSSHVKTVVLMSRK